VHGIDRTSDLAVLRIEADDLPAAAFADSTRTRVGEFAIAIGAPFNLDHSFTFGHVSAKSRSNVIPAFAGGFAMDQDFIQTDANINPGNSGGPLINIDGEVIGINTLIRGLHTGIGFAIAANLAREVSDQLIADGRVTRGWLGVGIVALKDLPELDAPARLLGDGLQVQTILRGGPASRSDLRTNDIILTVEGVPVATPQQLRNEVRSKTIGQPVTLDISRDGVRLTVEIKPEEHPETVSRRR
jgi:serine protease Do